MQLRSANDIDKKDEVTVISTPANTQPKVKASQLYKFGYALLQQSPPNYYTALDFFSQAIATDSTYYDAHRCFITCIQYFNNKIDEFSKLPNTRYLDVISALLDKGILANLANEINGKNLKNFITNFETYFHNEAFQITRIKTKRTEAQQLLRTITYMLNELEERSVVLLEGQDAKLVAPIAAPCTQAVLYKKTLDELNNRIANTKFNAPMPIELYFKRGKLQLEFVNENLTDPRISAALECVNFDFSRVYNSCTRSINDESNTIASFTTMMATINEFRKSLMPTQPDQIQKKCQQHLNQAIDYFSAKNYSSTISNCNIAILLDTDNKNSQLLRAQALVETRNWNEAYHDLTSCLTFPNNSIEEMEMINCLLHIVYKELNELELAEQALKAQKGYYTLIKPSSTYMNKRLNNLDLKPQTATGFEINLRPRTAQRKIRGSKKHGKKSSKTYKTPIPNPEQKNSAVTVLDTQLETIPNLLTSNQNTLSLEIKEHASPQNKFDYKPTLDRIKCIGLKIGCSLQEILTVLSENKATTLVKGGFIRSAILYQLHGIKTHFSDYDCITTQQHESAIKQTQHLTTTYSLQMQISNYAFAQNLKYIKFLRLNNEPITIDVITNSKNPPQEYYYEHCDFTINSAMWNPSSKEFYLPTPEITLYDFQNKLVRSVEVDTDNKRMHNPTISFKRDPIRILRAIDLCNVIDGKIEEKTLKAMLDCRYLLACDLKKKSNLNYIRVNIQLKKMFFNGNAVLNYNLMKKIGLIEQLFPQLGERDETLVLSTLAEIDTLIKRKVAKNLVPSFSYLYSMLMVCTTYPEEIQQGFISAENQLTKCWNHSKETNGLFAAEINFKKNNNKYIATLHQAIAAKKDFYQADLKSEIGSPCSSISTTASILSEITVDLFDLPSAASTPRVQPISQSSSTLNSPLLSPAASIGVKLSPKIIPPQQLTLHNGMLGYWFFQPVVEQTIVVNPSLSCSLT